MGPCVECTKYIKRYMTSLWILSLTPIVCEASQSLMDACDGFLVSEVDSTLEAKSVTASNSLFLCLMNLQFFFFRIERPGNRNVKYVSRFFLCVTFCWMKSLGKEIERIWWFRPWPSGRSESTHLLRCSSSETCHPWHVLTPPTGWETWDAFCWIFIGWKFQFGALNIKLVFLYYPDFFAPARGSISHAWWVHLRYAPENKDDNGKTWKNNDLYILLKMLIFELAMFVFKGVFFPACLRILFEAMPDGTDSPIWRALSAQVRREIYGQGGM